MTRIAASLCLISVLALDFAAFASSPERSLRPIARQDFAATATSVNLINQQTGRAPVQSQRPAARSGKAIAQNDRINAREVSASNSERPKRRVFGLFTKRAKKGAVCGVPGIEGARVKPVVGRIRGCGVSEPVRITAVDGVSLNPPAVMDCPTANALNTWVSGPVKSAVKRKGGGVTGLRVAAHYACRTRNNRRGARISEHGKGRAIDISAIQLKDGSSLTVLRDWRSKNRKIMRSIHKGACGPFGTVLGPNSDRYHQDHFHFDTARYRSGPYCR